MGLEVSGQDTPAFLNTDVCRVSDYCFVSAFDVVVVVIRCLFFNNCLVADIHKLQILEYILAAFSINVYMYIFERKGFYCPYYL